MNIYDKAINKFDLAFDEAYNKGVSHLCIKDLMDIKQALERAKKEHELLDLLRDYKSLHDSKDFHRNAWVALKSSGSYFQEDYIIYEKCRQDIITKASQIEKLEEE